MVNLYSLEQIALDRQAEMRKQSLQHSLLWQAADARPRPRIIPVAGSSVRSELGRLLVRAGQRLNGTALPQQRACTRPCVCVPVNS